MANELVLRMDPLTGAGLTITGRVRNPDSSQVGGDVSMTEHIAGFYGGNFSLAAVGDGSYIVEFLNSAGSLLGVGELNVKNNAQIGFPQISNDVWNGIELP